MAIYPPEIAASEGARLTDVTKDWALANGLTVRPPPAVIAAEADPHSVLATTIPVTLFPSPFPRVCFEQGIALQRTYNELYVSISQDEEFLARMVKEVGDSDDFITELWKVHLRVKEEGYVQHKSLGLFRSDYMVHQDAIGSEPQLKQVEFNTIAASFGGLSTQTSQLHKYLSLTEYPLLEKSVPGDALDLPPNDSAAGLAAGIREAFISYGASTTGHRKCVIFLVQGGEHNIFDQRHLEYALQSPASGPAVPVFRLPCSEIFQHTRLAEGAGRQLLYTPPHSPRTGPFEVAVVYMRSGYGPGDYPDAGAWEARYHFERSAAIKCPSVLTQIAGIKKVQQVLAAPGTPSDPPVLGRYLPSASPSALSALEGTFTDIYPLDGASEAGRTARGIATDPELCQGYVLKPQREGGGNNVYRAAIPPFLETVPEAHWPSYILMKLITPPPVHNTILRNGKLEAGGVICELGIYGTCFWDRQTKTILHNEQAGYLLRTKGDQSEEGGVAAGFGCIDSCTLV
ncbi:putative glutathione synthetase [Rosellinia necatrix]|uniref:Glutathione synthetase n=1 Tax=Rosellinia necatrix TaxID=77044 RepID=A0A1W2TM17_ROSNE|nr:putative glutathione synthetase [Rosellinia necatrix]